MNKDLVVVLLLLGAAIVMLAINRPRTDAVAILAMVTLPLTGVIDPSEALTGFGNPTVVLIAAMFVIGEGLARTGVAQRLGDWLVRTGGGSELRLLVLLMAIVGLMGSVMSSTGIVAIFIPVVMRIAARTGGSPGRLMMPMAYAALVSGMLTLVATAPNLVVNYELIRQGEEGFEFFSFTPIGLPVLVLGIVYMAIARAWLPSNNAQASQGRRRPRLMDWVTLYGLADREERLRVTGASSLLGQALDSPELPGVPDARVVAVERRGRLGRRVLRPSAATELRVGDILLVDRDSPGFDRVELLERLGLKTLPLSGAYFADRSQEVGMAEVMVPADSRLIGKTISELRMRTRFDLSAVGLRRGRTAHLEGFAHEKLKLGDTLLLVGPWKGLRRLQSEGHDLVVLGLPAEIDEVLPAAKRAPQAVLALLVTVGLMVSGLVSNVQAAFIGCLLMGLFRCIDFESAYRSISWKSLVMIVGMLPFATALERTGGVDLAADGLIALVGGAGTLVVLGSLYLITVVLGLFVVNTANAVLIVPVALAVAEELGASPYPFAMIVALAASSAFMTPISPVNALVATAGNYGFADFVRIGFPFTLIAMAVSLLLVPLLLPLY